MVSCLFRSTGQSNDERADLNMIATSEMTNAEILLDK